MFCTGRTKLKKLKARLVWSKLQNQQKILHVTSIQDKNLLSAAVSRLRFYPEYQHFKWLIYMFWMLSVGSYKQHDMPWFCPKAIRPSSFFLLFCRRESSMASTQSFAEPKDPAFVTFLSFERLLSLPLDLTRVMRCCQEKAISWTCLTLYQKIQFSSAGQRLFLDHL